MIIKKVGAKKIKDSRGEDTIEVSINTNVGKFSSSAPNGKSKGKYEAKTYKKNLEGDIKSLNDLSEYFSSEHLEKFEDLRRIEDIVKGHVGANTLFALESSALKAISKEQKKEVWEIINSDSKTIPRFVGNAIGGGLHSDKIIDKRPDFQEFLLISNEGNAKKNFDKNLESKESLEEDLIRKDKKFSKKKNDENAWATSLNEKEVLEILKKLNIPLGVDIAASSFYKRKKYLYENPPLKRDAKEQLMYLYNLIKNFNLFYVEDPFDEEDFESFAELLKRVGDKTLIVGDDLTVTNYSRVKKAIEKKSINALLMKPNQNGSLIDFSRIFELAKENGLKIIFSHRSGETAEDILADLAVGFGADFIKCGITGKERLAKIKRIIEIEKQINFK